MCTPRVGCRLSVGGIRHGWRITVTSFLLFVPTASGIDGLPARAWRIGAKVRVLTTTGSPSAAYAQAEHAGGAGMPPPHRSSGCGLFAPRGSTIGYSSRPARCGSTLADIAAPVPVP